MTAIFWIFVSLILLAPLPFGMVHEIIQAAFAFMIFLLGSTFCIYRVFNRSDRFVPLRRIAPETIAFALIMGWSVVQLLSVTPLSLHHPLWAETGEVLEREISGAVSLAPGAGFQALIRLATYAVVFWMALQLGRNRLRARRIFDMLILAGTLYAAYGMLMEVEGMRKILWVNKHSGAGWVSGTFVNRNTFATYTGLSLLCAVGAYLSDFLNLHRQGRLGRDRLVVFWNTALVQGAPRLASILILVSALFLSGSRGGIVSTLFTLLIFLVLYGTLQSARRRFSALVAGALIGALTITAMSSGDRFFWRLITTDIERESRLHVYEQVRQAIRSAPLTGFGPGSFEQAFPLYADLHASRYDRSHNDWLETIFEMGWPAALLWFALLAGMALRCFAGFFKRERDHLYPLVGFCATLLIGVHAFVDFSMQIPAVALTFATLMGIGIAQSYSSRE